ncbi:four-carbon acid sugar kinase family protein, partial [Arthrobacter deserti]|nr:four-carbon acid sugar kinase family protein [Arthrobacter deserti]
GFVSRSDSTLRGHYPLEPNVIAEVLEEVSGEHIDGVVIVPAFPDAGRLTIGGVHYVRGEADTLAPVAETEFAQDATFGFPNPELAKYVEEKSAGQSAASDVIVLDLDIVRAGTDRIADALAAARDSAPVVVDIVTENDFRALALGLDEAERRGMKLLYRVGPPFVRGRIGQEVRAPLTSAEAYAGSTPSPSGGLIVV